MKSLMYFWAAWCYPCEKVKPFVERMREEGFEVIVVNVDEEPQIARQYQIMSIPALLVEQDNVEIERQIGASAAVLKRVEETLKS